MRPGRRTQPRGLQHPRQYEGHPDRIGRAGPPVAGRIPGPAVDDDGRPFRGRGGRSRGGKDRLRHSPGPDATGPIRRPAAVEGRRSHNRASHRPGAPRAPRPVRTGEGTNRVGSSQAGRCPAPAQASRGQGRGRPCPHSTAKIFDLSTSPVDPDPLRWAGRASGWGRSLPLSVRLLIVYLGESPNVSETYRIFFGIAGLGRAGYFWPEVC